MDRELVWVGTSLKDLRQFPKDVRQDMGFALRRVQWGESPPQQKRLKGLAGVYEIREDGKDGTYRAVYAMNLGDAIYVLHAFQKKAKKGIATPRADMDVVRVRLAQAKLLAKGRSDG